MQGAWTPWAPDAEKTRLVGAHFCGGPLGTFLVLITGGKLISSFGWETIFYCSAGQSSNPFIICSLAPEYATTKRTTVMNLKRHEYFMGYFMDRIGL